MLDQDNFDRKASEVMIAECGAIQHAIISVKSESFKYLAHLLATVEGKAVITGVGKSAITARKIAATLATCTIPTVFIDPVGLYHGELGALSKKDIVIFCSLSGETEELTRLLTPLQSKGCTLASLVGNPFSTLGRLSICIATHCTTEPFGKIPTATAAAMVALGDALAVVAAMNKNVTDKDMLSNHPGGSIGKQATS